MGGTADAGQAAAVSSSVRRSGLSALSMVLLAVLVGWIYAPALGGEFLFDDDALISNCPQIRAPDGLYQFWCTTRPIDYWPVTNTSFWLEWRLWGRSTTGYHVTNVLLHGAAAVWIWVIFGRLRIPGALLGAVLFAVHPVNVRSVAWIAQRKNVLSMVFLLASVWCFLRLIDAEGRDRRGRWHALSVVCFLVAMLSKGSVVVLPLVLVWISWWQRPDEGLMHRWRQLLPFGVIAAVLCAVDIWFQSHGAPSAGRDALPLQRVADAGWILCFYLREAVHPAHLVFFYPPWQTDVSRAADWSASILAVAVTFVLVVYRRPWARSVLFAWGFYCIALLPVLGFLDFGFMRFSPVGDHYQYIAIIAVCGLTGAVLSEAHRRSRGALRGAVVAVTALLVGTLALAARHESAKYSRQDVLDQETLAVNPNCWAAHNSLGMELAKAGRYREALDHYRRALLQYPDCREVQTNIGNVMLRTGRLTDALGCYEKALRADPDYVEALNNTAVALLQLGRVEQSEGFFRHALSRDDDYFEAHANFAVALDKLGRLDEAADQLERALRIQANAALYVNLAQLYLRLGRRDEAARAAPAAADLGPRP